jgi:hypothetical protein
MRVRLTPGLTWPNAGWSRLGKRHEPLTEGPDPRRAGTAAEFVAQLRLLKVWAGSPSYERLARASGIPRSTLIDALGARRERLPALDVVRRFVLACGVDDKVLSRWEAAWRRLRAELDGVRDATAWAPVRLGLSRGAPAQLPLDVPGFVGREAEGERLDAVLSAAGGGMTVLIGLFGMAGVGKTALALHWAHRIRDRFADGQLYANLRGFDPADPALSPAEALADFLQAFGVPPQRVPAGLDARASLYRSLLTGRRVLVMLDNARDAEQVRPLLPGTPGCLVVVTSRNTLSGLVAAEGAHPITLDVLSEAEAHRMLSHRLGVERVAAERKAVDDIIARSARLPLALAIAAAQASAHPDRPLAAVTGQPHDAFDGLDAFSSDDMATDIRALFSCSYRAVGADAARLFRLMSLSPEGDLSVADVTRLAGTSVARVRRLTAELTNAHMVSEDPPGRFTLHGLMRVYAADLTRRLDSEADRQAALHRLLAHYPRSAEAGERSMDPLHSA